MEELFFFIILVSKLNFKKINPHFMCDGSLFINDFSERYNNSYRTQ